jgi:LysM repeat protein
MENDSISSSSSESKLPLILGIAGFALGAAALVLGYKAKGEAAKASAEADKVSQDLGAVSTAIAAKATLASVEALTADLNATKAAAEANNKSFTDAITQLQAAAKKAPAATAEKGGKTAAAAGPGEYSVVSGDNFSKIAKKVGITQKALTDLNPGVDSTKLRIGQKLKTK